MLSICILDLFEPSFLDNAKSTYISCASSFDISVDKVTVLILLIYKKWYVFAVREDIS